MKIACAIPARLESKRFPRKVLADVGGEPLVCHVWRQLSQIAWLDELCVVTDSTEVRDAVEQAGGRVLMSSPNCASGTERIWSVLDQIPGDVVINVQADQVYVSEDVLSSLVAALTETDADVATPIYRITSIETLFDPNRVKVVCGNGGRALYFSRSPIPYVRDVPREGWRRLHDYWGHSGIYAFRREVLQQYGDLPRSVLETVERLEQLRWLAGGWSIQAIPVDRDLRDIDTPAEIECLAHFAEATDDSTGDLGSRRMGGDCEPVAPRRTNGMKPESCTRNVHRLVVRTR